MGLIFMKFGTHKSNMNILLGIDDRDPRLQVWAKCYEIWHSQQIEHANYEYKKSDCL